MPDFDKESLNEWVETDEGKEFFNGMFSTYAQQKGYKSPEDIEGLLKNRDKLLGQVTKLNRENTTKEQQEILRIIAENDLDDPEILENIISSKQENGKVKDDFAIQLRRMEKKIETIENEKIQLSEKAQSERQKRMKTIKENAITKALKKTNVKDKAFDFLYDYFEKRAEIEEGDDDSPSIIALDSEGLRPSIDKYIEQWSKTEDATDFINKPVNKGAGMSGSSATGSKIMLRDAFESLPQDQRNAFIKDGGDVKD